MVSSTLKIAEKPVTSYPKSVAFIISNEFCERFNYYGMRTILVLYLTQKLAYEDDEATVLFHVFTSFVYLFPLIGAILADSWLGRFKTILYLSVIYSIGGVVIAAGAIPTLHLPVKAVTILGLALIAIGTGGIKPCVSAFGGDQFKIPEQAKQLATFFSLFYFAINAGSLISTTITPILREDVHCFNENDCFSLAFGVPAVLMVVSLLIFAVGKSLYTVKQPSGNMIVGVFSCITEAIKARTRETERNPRSHWLDYAEPKCGKKLVKDTKALLKILVLYLPLPVFWALFDQQGSRWTFQATRMVGDIGSFNIKPDQMQVINPLLILVFIPLFNYVIYPLLAYVGIKRPLQKLTLGGLLAAAAFMLSAFVELKLEQSYPYLPHANEGQLRIYNGMPCNYNFTTSIPDHHHFEMHPMSIFQDKGFILTEPNVYIVEGMSENDELCPRLTEQVKIQPGKAVSYFMKRTENGTTFIDYIEKPEKPKAGNPHVRVLMNVPDNVGPLMLKGAEKSQLINSSNIDLFATETGKHILSFGSNTFGNVEFKLGGVYVLLVEGSMISGYHFRSIAITEPNSVHMLWQLPQYIVMTAGEVMFSVTGLEFSFTQAPTSMKSVLQACWLLTVAIGNMLVVVIAELKIFESQAAEFSLFAILMLLDMVIFMLLTLRYTYVEQVDDEPEDHHERMDKMESQFGKPKIGHSNQGFVSDS